MIPFAVTNDPPDLGSDLGHGSIDGHRTTVVRIDDERLSRQMEDENSRLRVLVADEAVLVVRVRN